MQVLPRFDDSRTFYAREDWLIDWLSMVLRLLGKSTSTKTCDCCYNIMTYVWDSSIHNLQRNIHITSRRNHHHHEQAPSWRIAVSTRCFQCSRSWVYFHAELRPRLRGWRSASRVRSQAWRGRPGGRLQSLGIPLMETLSALVETVQVLS